MVLNARDEVGPEPAQGRCPEVGELDVDAASVFARVLSTHVAGLLNPVDQSSQAAPGEQRLLSQLVDAQPSLRLFVEAIHDIEPRQRKIRVLGQVGLQTSQNRSGEMPEGRNHGAR